MKFFASLLLILILPLSLKADTAQKDLDKARSEKLNAIARAIVEGDAKKFRIVLDDGRSVFTNDDAVALLKAIHSRWGDVSLDEKPENVANLSKSAMNVVAQKSFETTAIGQFVTMHSDRAGNRVLRIYLLFPKSQSRIGAFTAAEFPKP